MFYILFLRFSKYKHVIICVSMKLSSKKVMWFFKNDASTFNFIDNYFAIPGARINHEKF